jgi:glycosyltransferase involved in cell wall biosynthesis
VGDRENEQAWKDLLEDLKGRGGKAIDCRKYLRSFYKQLSTLGKALVCYSKLFPSEGAPMEVKKRYSSMSLVEDRRYPSISIVIPARNEAPNLRHVLPRIPSMVNEVILVDGNSTDDTIEVAKELLPSIRIIKQDGRGKGNALRVGFAACSSDIIVMLDADGSADPREIPCFVEALMVGRDFAKGSRFIRGGGSQDITLLRRFGNFCLGSLVNILFSARFSDLCYGYNAFWRHCLDYIEVDCDGFEVETMINLRIHKVNLQIVEVASFEYPRIHGESNLRAFRDGWRVLKTILKEWAYQLPEAPINAFKKT